MSLKYPQIWYYPKSKRNKIKRVYLKWGPCQIQLQNYKFLVYDFGSPKILGSRTTIIEISYAFSSFHHHIIFRSTLIWFPNSPWNLNSIIARYLQTLNNGARSQTFHQLLPVAGIHFLLCLLHLFVHSVRFEFSPSLSSPPIPLSSRTSSPRRFGTLGSE